MSSLLLRLPADEEKRLDSLRSLRILDTPAEERYDRITRLVSSIFKVPVSYISMVDADRQWFKSIHGLTMCQTARSDSFCTYTIMGTDAMVIPNALEDSRFARNTFVIGEPHVRFYAGQPLMGPNEQVIGTLCLVDFTPRDFSFEERKLLKEFAGMVEHELRLVDQISVQEKLLHTQTALLKSQEKLRKEMQEGSRYVESLLPSRQIQGPVEVDWSYRPSEQLGGDAFSYYWLDRDHLIFFLLDVAGHGLGATLLAISVLETLRERNLPGVDFTNPSQVLEKLNSTFAMSRHDNKYFTLWYGLYNASRGDLVYATGGHPQAILLSHNNRFHLLGKPGHLIGAFPQAQYQNQTESLLPDQTLYLFSDGLYEAADGSGERWSLNDLGNFLNHLPPGLKADEIIENILKMRHLTSFQDDVSLLKFKFESFF